jgi:cytochrome c553
MLDKILCTLFLAVCLPSVVQAEGDAQAGKQKVMLCAQCHGVDGRSTDPKIPKLSGQLSEYIVQATLEFQQGIRRDPVMSSMANVIQQTQDLEDIAAYYSQQVTMAGQAKPSEEAITGEKLFTSARCNYCHADGGRRFAPFKMRYAPVIGGQHKAYLIKALNDIKSDKRPGDEYDMMKKLLGELSDNDISAIAEYLSSL